MIRKFTYLVLIGWSLFLTSCKKEIDGIPESNDPIYRIEGTIDGKEVVVDVDGIEANYSCSNEMVNGVRFFKGNLVADEFELELGLFDGNIDKNSFSLIDVVNLQQLAFAKEQETELFYASKFNFNTPEFIASIDWYLDGVYFSTDEILINEPGKYQLCAKVQFIDQTEKMVCNEIIVGYKKNAVFSLQTSLNQENNLSMWIDQDQSPVSTVDWYFDGKFVSNELTFSGKIDKLVHEIKADVVFQNGTKRSRTVLVDGNGDKASVPDFARFENTNKVCFDFTSKIVYRKDGVEYSSFFADNSTNKLTISKINHIGKDESQNDVFLIEGTLKATLKSKQNGKLIDIDLAVSWGVILK